MAEFGQLQCHLDDLGVEGVWINDRLPRVRASQRVHRRHVVIPEFACSVLDHAAA